MQTKRSNGFTMIEALVIGVFTVLFATFLIVRFSASQLHTDRLRFANLLAADIRDMQIWAATSRVLDSDGSLRCGYGIHRKDTKVFYLYAGPDVGDVECATHDRGYNEGGPQEDTVIKTVNISDRSLRFPVDFPDIFFEPPDPKTFVCMTNPCDADDTELNDPPGEIIIKNEGSICPNNCTTIYVYTSGKIEVQ